jgi:hypothetical protein
MNHISLDPAGPRNVTLSEPNTISFLLLKQATPRIAIDHKVTTVTNVVRPNEKVAWRAAA